MRLGFPLIPLILILAAHPHDSLADNKTKQQPQPEPIDLSQPLTLEQAIKIGLQNHPALGIAKSQVEASRARLTQAHAGYFPQIAPTFDYSTRLSTVTVNGIRQTGTIEEHTTAIGLNQLIFDMGKREENVLVSRYSKKATEYNVLDARQAIIVNVTGVYYDLMRRKELVKVSQSSVERAKTTLEATKAFAEAGTGPKKDILQAEADYQNALVQFSEARNNVRLAATSLKNAMGILTLLPVTTPDASLPNPPAEPDSRQVPDYLKLAFDRRPDLKREGAGIDANRHEVKIANINAGVQVQANVSEGYRIDPNPGENRAFTTGVSYPLFDAGSARAQVRQAKASLDQSRKQLELTKQGIQLEVEQAYLSREEARFRMTAVQAALRAARENYEAATASRREGAGTIIDVITAQTALVTAETNAVQALFDYYTSDARLKRAIGDNDPYLAAGGP